MAGLFGFGCRGKKREADTSRLIGDAAFVVIDTELTGLNGRKDSIVSVGAVRMNGSRISLGDPFYRLVRPKTALTRESVIIHGITPSDVAAEEDSASVLGEFAAYCGTGIIVGHCVAIDLEFIEREMKRALNAGFRSALVDTAGLFRWLKNRSLIEKSCPSLPAEPDLYRLAECLEIPVTETHHALTDAFITAQVFQRFLSLLAAEGIATVGDLIRIGDPRKSGKWILPMGEIGSL